MISFSCPEFKAGAMENAGCVTFRDIMFRSGSPIASWSGGETILHEMAHMWFGDLVTMRWWDDLWLNESFADWATPRAVRGDAVDVSLDHVRAAVKSWAYRQDQLPSTHPIAADIGDIEAVEVNFDGITYAKGASVLKQLVRTSGGRTSWTACASISARRVGQRDSGGPAGALEQTSGRDLRLVDTAGCDRRGHHAAAETTRWRRPVHRGRGGAGGRAQPSAAALAPDRHRPVRPDRRRAGAPGG